MKRLTDLWIRIAVAYFAVGVPWVLRWVPHNFTLRPVHAHVNPAGWVSMFLMGLLHQHLADSLNLRLARVQFWIYQTRSAGDAICPDRTDARTCASGAGAGIGIHRGLRVRSDTDAQCPVERCDAIWRRPKSLAAKSRLMPPMRSIQSPTGRAGCKVGR